MSGFEVWLSCGDETPHLFATLPDLEGAMKVAIHQERTLNKFAEDHGLGLRKWTAKIKEVAECQAD